MKINGVELKETKSQERLLNELIKAGAEWPEGANYAAQDGMSKAFDTGRVCGYRIKPVRAKDDKSWLPTGGDGAVTIVRGISPLPNWHQTIITRDQWLARDGWITWYGGECPVGGGELVDTLWDDGFHEAAGHSKAEDYSWSKRLGIIGYRPHKPAQYQSAPVCESAEKTIPLSPTLERLINRYNETKRKVEVEHSKLQEQADRHADAIKDMGVAADDVRQALYAAGWGE